jgi:two-component system, NtrC family, sensor histidine kinase KinB
MKPIFRFNVREKILLGFGLVIFILLIVFAVSLSSLLKLGKASDAILKQNYLSIEATNHMLDAIEQHYRLVFAFSHNSSDSTRKAIFDEQLRFEQWLVIEKGNITEKGEQDAANRLEQSYRNYLYKIHLYEEKSFPSIDQAYQYLNDVVRVDLNRIRDVSNQIMSINQAVMFKASNNAKLVAHKATYTLIIIGIIGILLAMIFSLSLSSIIVRPLTNMLAALEKVANGDYTTRIEHHSTDELGIVSNEFNVMAQKLSEYNELNIRSIVREKQINEAILQNMDDGMFLVDAEYHITNSNLSGTRLFNSTPEACKGKHILEIIRHEVLFDFIKETAEQGIPPAFSEGQNILITDQNNAKQYLQFHLTPVFMESGVLLGVMILFNDITHLKQLDKLKSEFLMIASHELKTPLTSINMSISLLSETVEPKLNDNEKELLHIAMEDTNRLKALISDLLDISKIEAGKIDLNFENIPVESFINKTLASFQTVAREKQITITSEVEPALLVSGDFSKITWIMTNLISNAIKFTPSQGTINIKAGRTGNFVQISVEDNGIGIPYEFQKKIFDKFFQVASPLNTGGTGLGLSISKEIVRAHGGSIWVESEPNKGSTFYFTLPLA